MRFAPTSFVPTASKYAEQTCHGCAIAITDRDRLKPFRTGVAIVRTLHDLYPDRLQWKVAHFDRLCGTDAVRRAIIDGTPLEKLETGWQADAARFRETRRPYLLYRESVKPGLAAIVIAQLPVGPDHGAAVDDDLRTDGRAFRADFHPVVAVVGAARVVE